MKRIVIILIGLIAITSCQDYLDVNKDPNNASQTTPALTLPAGIASAAGQFASYYNIVGGMWVQYWTQNNGSNQYKNIDSYNVQQSTLNTNFNELYSGSLEDLQYVRDESKKAGDWSLYLMGTVMQCYVFQMLADTYDQIAFDEALHGSEILHPNYRSGQQVYDSLIVRLDDALSKDFDAITVTNPGSSDFLFGGSVTSWIQFANTLKLKIYLRQVYARPEVANPGIQGLYDNGAEFLAESAAMTQFVDQENKSNPLYECDQRKLNTAQNIKASKTFMDFLLNNSDPRVDALFIPGSGGQKGLEQGNFGAPTTVVNPATISRALIQATDPVYFLSAAESYFLQAEAAARGFGSDDEKELYEAGISAAFEQLGLDASDAEALFQTGGPYEYPGADLDSNLKAIMTQKWVALAGFEGMEAFFERNRTGYPAHTDLDYSDAGYELGTLVYPIGGSSGTGNFPMRLLFPETEQNRNPNTPSQVPFTTKVWWDKNDD